MEMIFVRHAEGEHTINLPDSLHIADPSLTKQGIEQANSLKIRIPLNQEELLIVSPIRRTLQTAMLWSKGTPCLKYVTPFVGPRLFPLKQNGKTLPCDRLMPISDLKNEFPDFVIDNNASSVYWENGINCLPENQFSILAKQFIGWCNNFNKERIFIVTHDGTITAYRQFLMGEQLTRDDFLGETGWIKITV